MAAFDWNHSIAKIKSAIEDDSIWIQNERHCMHLKALHLFWRNSIATVQLLIHRRIDNTKDWIYGEACVELTSYSFTFPTRTTSIGFLPNFTSIT